MGKILDFVLWFFDISFITFAPIHTIALILKKDEGYLCAIYSLGFFSIFGILRMLYRLRNSLQTFFVCLSVWIIVLMCLFPPWQNIYKIPHSNIKGFAILGYGFIAAPPPNADTIDFPRLGLQCGIVFLITGALFYILSTTQKIKKPTDMEIN